MSSPKTRVVPDPSYPAARAVAPKVRAHFERLLESAAPHDRRSVLPDADAIEAIIDAAFWASLRREEGYVPKISLAFLAPGETAHPLTFERPLSLDPDVLTRIAPAVE